MSRNTNTNNTLVPVQSSSSTSQLSSSPAIHQHFYTVNITINYMAPSASIGPHDPAPSDNAEKDLKMISRLAGQQMKDLYKEERRRSRRSSSRQASRSSSRRSSKEVSFPPEVDALPIVLEHERTDDATQRNTDDNEHSETPLRSEFNRIGSEYQDLASIMKQKYRIVPSKRVKAVPEEQLPKKKFNKDKTRREYVILGTLNSLEPIPDKSDEEKKADSKKRSRELARELY